MGRGHTCFHCKGILFGGVLHYFGSDDKKHFVHKICHGFLLSQEQKALEAIAEPAHSKEVTPQK